MKGDIYVYSLECMDDEGNIKTVLAQDKYYFRTKAGAKWVANAMHQEYRLKDGSPKYKAFRIRSYTLCQFDDDGEAYMPVDAPPRNPRRDTILGEISRFNVKSPVEFFARIKHGHIILPRGELIAFINYMKRTVGEEEFRRLDNLNNFGFDWEEEDQ